MPALARVHNAHNGADQPTPVWAAPQNARLPALSTGNHRQPRTQPIGLRDRASQTVSQVGRGSQLAAEGGTGCGWLGQGFITSMAKVSHSSSLDLSAPSAAPPPPLAVQKWISLMHPTVTRAVR